MKTLRLVAFTILILCSERTLCECQGFVGKWEVGRNGKTGDANITITLVGSDQEFRGKVAFRNPDNTFMLAEIRHTVLKGETLEFQTLDRGVPFYWSLTLNKDGRRALLRGHQHEIIIEETAIKAPC